MWIGAKWIIWLEAFSVTSLSRIDGNNCKGKSLKEVGVIKNIDDLCNLALLKETIVSSPVL